MAREVEGDRSSKPIRWLSDDNMLPASLRKGDLGKLPARIFTYSWEAGTFRDASSEYFKTQAETLLQKINEFRKKVRRSLVRLVP